MLGDQLIIGFVTANSSRKIRLKVSVQHFNRSCLSRQTIQDKSDSKFQLRTSTVHTLLSIVGKVQLVVQSVWPAASQVQRLQKSFACWLSCLRNGTEDRGDRQRCPWQPAAFRETAVVMREMRRIDLCGLGNTQTRDHRRHRHHHSLSKRLRHVVDAHR